MMASEQQVPTDEQHRAARPTVIHVRAKKPSITLAETGFTVVSGYVEQFWQSALGPTSTALIRHLARHRLPVGGESASYVPIDLALTRAALGIGRKGQEGKSGPLFKSVHRLARFGFLTVDEHVFGGAKPYHHCHSCSHRPRRDQTSLARRTGTPSRRVHRAGLG